MSIAIASPESARQPYGIGLWLCWPIALLQLVNAVRSFYDPAGFAGYLGLPLDSAADTGFVMVYGLRAGFIGALTLLLVWQRAVSTLRNVALLALIMPAGDAWLTWQAGAAGTTVGRHLAIGLFLLVTAVLLHRQTRSSPQ